MPKMYTQRTKQTALLSALFATILAFSSFKSIAGDIVVTTTLKSYNGADVSCYGTNDAQITISAQGGSGNYTYSVDNGKNFQSSNVFTKLEGGKNYVIVVKDAKGQLSAAKWIWVSTVYNPVTISSTYATKSSCPTATDGEISVSAYGGTGSLVYSIDNGNKWQSETGFKNLVAGTYTVIAKDLNGCTSAYKTIKVESNGGIKAVIDYKEDYYCNWGNGSATVRGTEGKAPYMYSIDGLPYVSNGTFSHLNPGQHSVVVVDSKGCTASINFEINASLSATLSGDSTIVSGGTATLKVNINEGSARRTGYSLVLKGSDGKTYNFSNLRTGDNKIDIENIVANTTFTITKVTSVGGCIAYANGGANIKVELEKKSQWLGINSNWNDAINWSDGKIPTSNSSVVINQKAYSPIITEDAYAENITIGAGASLDITGKLILTGTMSGTPASVDAAQGTIEFSGTEMQVLNSSVLFEKSIRNMVINNDLSLEDSLNVFGYIKFDEDQKNLYTNDFMTLKSNAAGTAMVGNLSENNVYGNVTVENFIPARKGWKFLSVPTKGNQSIRDAWQEGQADGNVGVSGRGTQIPGDMSDWKAKGFDGKAFAPSLKTYNSNTDRWVGVTSMYEPFKDSSNAYMIFVRGDRASSGTNAPVTETTLRTKGELKSGEQLTYNIIPNKFVAVGNPYAAPVDLNKVKSTKNMFFYFWDPELGNNYGAYQTVKVNHNGTYKVVPGSHKMTKKQVLVESGQAFFVFGAKGGTVQFDEDAKVEIKEGKSNGRPGGNSGNDTEDDEMEIKLFSVSNNETKLLDGVLQSFNDSYSSGYDEMDALKSANTGESLSIRADGKDMSMESRPFASTTDSTQLNVAGLKVQSYRFEIALMQQPNGTEALLVDRFTNQSTPILVGTTLSYEFTVTKTAASYAANRFVIVFRPMKPMPVTFSGIKAEKKEGKVLVSWKVENEVNVKEYQVEKSADGVSFQAVGTVSAAKLNSYSQMDQSPVNGANYYRVVSLDIDGKKEYSEIVKVSFNNVANQSLTVYPNPVVGNTVNLQMNFQNNGTYYISIKNQIGQVVDNRKVTLSSSQNLSIHPSTKLSAGVYTVEVTAPTGEQSSVQFIK